MQRSGHCAHMRLAQKMLKSLFFQKWEGNFTCDNNYKLISYEEVIFDWCAVLHFL